MSCGSVRPFVCTSVSCLYKSKRLNLYKIQPLIWNTLVGSKTTKLFGEGSGQKQRFFISGVTFVGRGFQSVRKLPIEIKTNPLIPKISTNFKFPHSPPSNKAICRKIGQKIKIFHYTITFDIYIII